MRRRSLLAGLCSLGGGLLGEEARGSDLAAEPPLVSDLELSGDRAFGRAVLVVPPALPPQAPLLILLHGLGETHDQRVGARAFVERYGLLSALARLARPPLQRTLKTQDFFGEGRIAELNTALVARPFPKLALLCPYTPNPYKAGGSAVVARFADFLTGPLLQQVEARLGARFPAERRVISGVSLGGHLALEVFLRKPEGFCGVGSAQGAFGAGQARRYAAELEAVNRQVGRRSVELLSSSFDPYRAPNELLYKQLLKRSVPVRLRVSPGPHDQRWLRESGVIEMLVGARHALDRSEAEANP